MHSDAFPETRRSGMDTLMGRPSPSARVELHCLTHLARELRMASAEYRSLALYAGPLHRLTLESKRRVEQVNTMLFDETERLRSDSMTIPL